jgi:hypothetical protein
MSKFWTIFFAVLAVELAIDAAVIFVGWHFIAKFW